VISAVTTTVANAEQASALASAMVERRLAACAQFTPIDSVYVWQEKLQREPEVRVLFKTTVQLQPALMAAIAARHPYEIPEIHAETLTAVHQPYADWVAASVGNKA
jgi:periplasmic divalent cation tolerance protein